MHKKIGVIICEAYGTYQTKVLEGINNRAHSLGYDNIPPMIPLLLKRLWII